MSVAQLMGLGANCQPGIAKSKEDVPAAAALLLRSQLVPLLGRAKGRHAVWTTFGFCLLHHSSFSMSWLVCTTDKQHPGAAAKVAITVVLPAPRCRRFAAAQTFQASCSK